MVKIENLANTQKIQTNSPKKANKSNEKNEEVREQQELISSEGSNAYRIHGQQLLSNESNVQEPDVQETATQEQASLGMSVDEIKQATTNIKTNMLNDNTINLSKLNNFKDKLNDKKMEPIKPKILKVLKAMSIFILSSTNIKNLNNVIEILLDNNILESLDDKNIKEQYLTNIAKAAANTKDLSEDTIKTLYNNINNIDKDNKNEYLCNIAKAAANAADLSKDTILSLSEAAANTKNLTSDTINFFVNNINNIDKDNKAKYLCNIAQAASNTKDLSSDTIKTLLNNKDHIDDENKDEYLTNIAQAASKSKNINSLDFIFLLHNSIITSINNDNKAKYLCNIAKAAVNTEDLSSAIITILLNNIDNIEDKNKKAEYLCNIAKAAVNTKDLSEDTIKTLCDNIDNIEDKNKKAEYLCNIAKAVSKLDNLFPDEKIIKELYKHINSIKDNDKQGKALYALLEATSKTASKTLVNEAIKVFLNKCQNNKVENIPIQLAFYKLISIVDDNSFRFGSNKTIQNLVNIWDNIKFQNTKNSETQKITTAEQYKNLCLAHIAHATAKSTSLNNDTMTKLLDKIDDISSTNEKTKKQKQLAYIYTLSENLKINKKVNKDIIKSLFNKALNYGMFEDDNTNTHMQRTFVRNLIDAISRLDQNEAEELYTQLYTTATTTKDNTNPVKENDGKNDIDGYSSENLSNNAQSSYMPPKLTLFFAKLDKTLGYQQNTEIQGKLMNAITNTSLDEKEEKMKLAPKVSLCPALNYLQKDQLKAIDESAIANRIITTNDAKDIRQFELEYLIDLKLSHGLYELNTDEGRNKFIEILTDNYNYDILTNKFEPKMKYETQIEENVKMVISDKNYDGVYNLALIALKQMEPENRKEFLNKLIQGLESKNTDTTKDTDTISLLKGLLKESQKGKQFDNDKLLDTKPVLRQYNDKSKTVSKNYQPNLTSFRMPRTTDKCEIFKENGTTYLGFKGTSQKIETKLDTKKAELLFGSQSSSGHQMIGNCWLIATLKQIEANPQLKLAVYSHFDATVDKNNELQSVTINLKDGRKVTFSKDVVDEVSKIGATEHLSPAMSCLALLSAIYRKTEKNGKHDISQINKTISSSLQEKFSENQYDTDGFDDIYNLDLDLDLDIDNLIKEIDNELNDLNESNVDDLYNSEAYEYLIKEIDNDSNESNEQITAEDLKNAIINALRISNEGGNEFNDILSLFIDDKQDNIKDDTQSNGVNTIQVIGLYKHAIGKYGDFYLNPQNSHSLSIFNKASEKDEKKAVDNQKKEIYVNKIYKKDDTSYTIPQFKAETIYSKIKKSVNNIVNSFVGFFKKDNTKTNLSVNG